MPLYVSTALYCTVTGPVPIPILYMDRGCCINVRQIPAPARSWAIGHGICFRAIRAREIIGSAERAGETGLRTPCPYPGPGGIASRLGGLAAPRSSNICQTLPPPAPVAAHQRPRLIPVPAQVQHYTGRLPPNVKLWRDKNVAVGQIAPHGPESVRKKK